MNEISDREEELQGQLTKLFNAIWRHEKLQDKLDELEKQPGFDRKFALWKTLESSNLGYIMLDTYRTIHNNQDIV